MRNFDGMKEADYQALIREQDNRVLTLEKLIKEAAEIAFNSPELNLDNYTNDDVENLNNAMCEVLAILDRGA